MTPAERRRRILEGPIVPTVAALSAPNLLGVLAQTAVAVADAWFVGKLGVAALAALALAFPTQMLMGMMSAGAMGGGVSSAVARALGAGDRARAEAVAMHALALGAAMSVAFAVVFVGFGPAVYRALGGEGAILADALAYAQILFLGAIAVWTANMLASVLRGTGDTGTPARAFLAGAAVQIPLCGALTLGWGPFPQLGVLGPAASSVVSFALSAAMMAPRLLGERAALRLRFALRPTDPSIWRDLLKVGGVSSLVVLITNLTIMSVTGMVGRAGPEALAGYGVGSRLEYMLIPISFGVGAALTAMVGLNIGAGAHRRAQLIAWAGAAMAAVAAGAIGLVVAVWPDLWLRLYTDDAATLAQGRIYLRTVGPVYALFGLAMALYFASQGTGTMLWPLLANAVRISVAVGGGTLALDVFGFGSEALFVCVAAGIAVFAATLAASTFSAAWKPRPTIART